MHEIKCHFPGDNVDGTCRVKTPDLGHTDASQQALRSGRRWAGRFLLHAGELAAPGAESTGKCSGENDMAHHAMHKPFTLLLSLTNYPILFDVLQRLDILV